MASAPARSKWLRSRRAWLLGGALALVVAALYVWPARRNYYGKLDGLDVRLDVPYVPSRADRKQALDLYLPREGRRPFPLVLFVHGGYWSPLDRRFLQPLLGTHGNVGAAFARRGIAAAIVGYRQYPAIRHGDDSLNDIAEAVRFAREHAASWGVDPQRLFLMGHSAGGHLVSLLAMDPRILARHGVAPGSVAGFVSVDGIFDLGASLRFFEPEQAAVVRQLFGPDDATLADHSTSAHLHAGHPPLLVVDSTGDEEVCRLGFHALAPRLAALGGPARFVELDGLGHNAMIVRVGMPDDRLTPLVADFVAHPTAR